MCPGAKKAFCAPIRKTAEFEVKSIGAKARKKQKQIIFCLILLLFFEVMKCV